MLQDSSQNELNVQIEHKTSSTETVNEKTTMAEVVHMERGKFLPPSEYFRQFRLMFENVIYNKMGDYKMTLMEMFLPLYPALFLYFILQLNFIPYEYEEISAKTDYPLVPVFPTLNIPGQPQFNGSLLAFAPMSNPAAEEAAKTTCTLLGVDFEDTYKVAGTGELASLFENQLAAAVEFNEDATSFTIAHQDLGLAAIFQQLSLAQLGNETSPQVRAEEVVLTSGLATIQQAVNRAILLKHGSTAPQVGLVSMKQFPIPESVNKNNAVQFMFPLLFITALFINLQATMTSIGTEMERGIRETLLVKGMRIGPYWTAWIAGTMIFTVIAALVMLAALYGTGVLDSFGFGSAFALFVLYGFAQTAFSMTIPAIFGERVKARTLFMFGIVILLLSQVLFYVVQLAMIDAENIADGYSRIMFLIYPIPFAHVMWVVSDAELIGVDVSDDLSSNLTFAYIMLAVDGFLYLFIAIAVDMRREYLRSKPSKRSQTQEMKGKGDVSTHGGIKISELVRHFRTKDGLEKLQFWKKATLVKAVDGLNIDVGPNQIFCLLGHNGAGKTTAINCLKGTLPPTSGDAWIHGLHIEHNRSELRRSLGVCPQFDVLYDKTTAQRQLELFAGIAGLTREEARKEATQLLHDLHLTAKANEMAETLSGGQKRRLSLAVSLIGNPKIILLDEPTTGLDPRNRQSVWALLNRLKKNTTILITTHSMEEADVLGDTIGIMAEGKLQAIGTSMELKEQYGVGYHLHCVRSVAAESTDVTDLEEIVLRHVPNAELLSNVGTEVSFSLPKEHSRSFPALFRDLEGHREDAGILSFGLSPTTLEDVFLRLAGEEHKAEEEEDEEGKAKNGDEDTLPSGDKPSVTADAKERLRKGEALKLPSYECKVTLGRQAYGVLAAVFSQNIRNPGNMCFLVLYPIIMTIVAAVLSDVLSPKDPVPELLVPSLLPENETNPGLSLFPVVFDEAMPDALKDTIRDDARFSQFLGTEMDEETLFTQLEANATLNGRGEVDGAFIFRPSNFSTLASFDAELHYNQRHLFSSRVMLQMLFNSTEYPDASSPIAGYDLTWKSSINSNTFTAGGLTYFVALTFAMLSIMYIEDMVRLRETRVKSMMLLASLPRWLFWLSHAISHWLLFLMSWCVSYIVMYAMGMPGPAESSILPYIIIIVAFPFASIFYGYFWSFFCPTVQAAQEGMGEFQQLLLSIPWLIVTFALEEQNEFLELVLSFFVPGFGLYRCLAILESDAKGDRPFSAADTFDWDRGFIKVILAMVLSGMFYISLIGVLDHRVIQRTVHKIRKRLCLKRDEGDVEMPADDVEHKLPTPVSAVPVDAGDSEAEIKKNLPIYAKDVKKAFVLSNGSKFQAVKGVSFGAKRGNIFGLLGPNGAGKSTTFNSLGLQDGLSMDSGDAWVEGRSVVTQLEAARRYMGVCPQFDAVVEKLTGREQLRLFARLRGLPSERTEEVIDFYLDSLDLQKKANATAGSYSGGNKRRLSVALSMLANPSAVFLDEPSTGMDPATRRHLWNFLNGARENRAVVLTTHSMEEADALCSRIAIMVSGAIRTCGTSQELKNKHGTDHLVTIRLTPEAIDDSTTMSKLDIEMKKISPSSTCEDVNSDAVKLGLVKYTVPSGVSLASLFEQVNGFQDELGVSDFSVSQSSLEDVFVRLAEMQEDDD